MRRTGIKRIFGVTLFELLVVILITSILSAIFLLSSRKVLVTSKISRVKEEHSMLSQAIAHYQVDYNAIPPNTVGLKALSMTTKYVASHPSDPFNHAHQTEYFYLAEPSSDIKYILISAGPDGDIDFMPFIRQIMQQPYVSAETRDATFNSFTDNMTYDPTNGLNSNGDIITIVPAN